MTTIASVRDVSREYQQGPHTIRALDGVSLDVMQGDFMALMGPSGSGKSTLLNLLGGLDLPTAGEVTIEGHGLSTLGEKALSELRRDRLGFIFQSYNLIPVLTAFENAEFVLMLQGKSAAERRTIVMKTLAEVGLEGLEDRRPNELSGGQQQRVAVARAIAGKPALVLADEPTANLDSTTGHALIELMQRLNRDHGITFIFATHDPKVMEAATRVVELVDGDVASDTRQG
jgi:putative ABC transport system ATP-binding protein